MPPEHGPWRNARRCGKVGPPQRHSMTPVLFISTTFFPHPAVGGIRTTRLASHLPEFGYKPIVLARWYGHEATRELLDEHVHPEAEVIYLDRPAADAGATGGGGAPRSRLRRLRARLGPAAAAFLVPDATRPLWAGWTEKIERVIAERGPVAYVTMSPPFSTHVVGLRLRGRLDVAWIASYEDPYLFDPRNGPVVGARRLRAGAHRAFDRAVHERADIVLHTIPMQDRWSRLAYPEFRGKNRLITMGTPVELAEGRVEPDRAAAGVTSVRIVGFIGDGPALDLARAVASLREAGIDGELRLVGRPPGNLAAIREVLGDRVISSGYLRHDQALRQVLGADVLVNYLTLKRAAAYLLSSKYFEYLATGKPVLAINPTASDRHFLRRAPFVTMLEGPTPRALAEALLAAVRDPARRPPPGFAGRFAAEHSWREKTRGFAGILDELRARRA